MHNETWPYPIDVNYHPLAWVFFNAGNIPFDIIQADALARHVFDNLQCGAPGSAGDPLVKYDALGGTGAPWENGEWIAVDQPRAMVVATAPSVDLGSMDAQSRAELRAALDAADIAAAANALQKEE